MKESVLSGRVRKIGVNPYVRVSPEIIGALQHAAGRTKGAFPVKIRINRKPFAATVVRYQGMWRLYLNTMMRKEAGVEAGDTVAIGIVFDHKPRIVPVPEAFAHAMAGNPRARDAFEKLTPSRRNEILRYLNSLKRAETIEKNIVKIMIILEGEA
jgi:uncharacterized protein YdeI (YjbR/CyaY-like superfamily)